MADCPPSLPCLMSSVAGQRAKGKEGGGKERELASSRILEEACGFKIPESLPQSKDMPVGFMEHLRGRRSEKPQVDCQRTLDFITLIIIKRPL